MSWKKETFGSRNLAELKEGEEISKLISNVVQEPTEKQQTQQQPKGRNVS